MKEESALTRAHQNGLTISKQRSHLVGVPGSAV